MLKRNFGESPVNSNDPYCEGEPQAKRPNLASQFVYNASQNATAVKIPSQTVQNPTTSNTGLDKKPIDKSQFFDNVLEYFDKKPKNEPGGSNKQNVDCKQPVIIDLDAEDNSRPKSTILVPSAAQLPQLLLNPKARLNTQNMLKNPTVLISISDQKLRCYSGPKVKQGVPNFTPHYDRNSLPWNKSPSADDSLPITSQTQQPQCCVIEKLVRRFHYMTVKPVPEDELYSFIKEGRPTPALPVLGVSQNLYSHHLWITGCPTLGGLYCWICLLFVNRLLKTENSSWVREGFRHMKMLGTAMSKHITTMAHRDALSLKDKMVQNSVIPNFGSDFGESSADTKADKPLPPTKPVSATTNNQSVDILQNMTARYSLPPSEPGSVTTNKGILDILHNMEARCSLPQTKHVSSTAKSKSINVQNKASNSLPTTQPVSANNSNQPINTQYLPVEDAMKPASFESIITPNPVKAHAQTPQLDSSTSPNTTYKKHKKSNPAYPTAGSSRENLGAPQPQTSEPEIIEITNSDDYATSRPDSKELAGPSDSSKENLALCVNDVSEAEYIKLSKELEMKELLTPQPSVNDLKRPPGNPSTHPADTIKLPLSSRVIDLAVLKARFFLNGTFNGSDKLRELIITYGRPTPKMPGLSQEVYGAMRHFNLSFYERFPWMCGSTEMNRLFCWPCFMFNDHKNDTIWSSVGYNNLANLSSVARSHSNSQTHLELSMQLKLVESRTKNMYQKTGTDPVVHNETVCRKRSLMKYLIDAVCFKKKLLNNGEFCHDDFSDFLKILSNYDVKLKALLDPGSPRHIADFTPNFVENYSQEVTKALKRILQRKIAKEVECSAYVSFILKTVQNRHVALIVRYTKSSGEVYETFYKFIKIGFGLEQDLLKKVIAEVRGMLKCSAKFVGISYDGGVLGPDQMGPFNSWLRHSLRAAHFFHYRDENFQELLTRSLSHTPFCRSFFQLVTEFGSFLQDNPRAKTLIRRLEGGISRQPGDWDLKSGIVMTIRDHYSAIMKFLDQVVNGSLSPQTWTNQVVSQCSKFSMFLGLLETRLFLVLFSKIYVALHPVIEAFRGEFDAKYWRSATGKAHNAITDIRTSSFREMYFMAEEMVGPCTSNLSFSEKTKLSNMFNHTVDWVLAFIESRAKYIDMWSYFDFSTKKIDSFVPYPHQPHKKFHMDLSEYFPYFEPQKLGQALIFAQNHVTFRDKTAAEIIQVMNEFDFKSILPELYNYLLLIVTVPQSSANVISPASDRITTYVEGKTRLKSADALLHLEKDLLSSIRNGESFYEEVLKIISELKSTNEFTEIDPCGKPDTSAITLAPRKTFPFDSTNTRTAERR